MNLKFNKLYTSVLLAILLMEQILAGAVVVPLVKSFKIYARNTGTTGKIAPNARYTIEVPDSDKLLGMSLHDLLYDLGAEKKLTKVGPPGKEVDVRWVKINAEAFKEKLKDSLMNGKLKLRYENGDIASLSEVKSELRNIGLYSDMGISFSEEFPISKESDKKTLAHYDSEEYTTFKKKKEMELRTLSNGNSNRKAGRPQ